MKNEVVFRDVEDGFKLHTICYENWGIVNYFYPYEYAAHFPNKRVSVSTTFRMLVYTILHTCFEKDRELDTCRVELLDMSTTLSGLDTLAYTHILLGETFYDREDFRLSQEAVQKLQLLQDTYRERVAAAILSNSGLEDLVSVIEDRVDRLEIPRSRSRTYTRAEYNVMPYEIQ